jgi:hypothetical protein
MVERRFADATAPRHVPRPERHAMNKPQLPDLKTLSNRLAAHNGRVARFVDGLAARVDQMVAATSAGDWGEVRRQSEYLAYSSDLFGCRDVAQAAQAVFRATDAPHDELMIRRNVIHLVGRCGAVNDAAKPSKPATTTTAS